MKMGRPPIEYSPLVDRPPLRWPNDARVALWVQVNIEHWEVTGPGTSLQARYGHLIPDALNAGWRDYGGRVGIWRLMDVLDRHRLRASAPLNAEVCVYYPEIVREAQQRDWELMGHGLNNSRNLNGLELEAERAVIRQTIDAIGSATGKAPKGWLGPGLAETFNTLDLLAEGGIEWVADWCNDDQPYPIDVRSGRLIGIPYSMEVNDIPAFVTHGLAAERFCQVMCDQFDVLYEEGARSGRILGLCLHPFIAGQAFRAKWVAKGLEYILGHDGVWAATTEEIAAWYYERYYSDALAQVRRRAATVPAPDWPRAGEAS
jgi:peptidoglycan/xylan/chitin deacetylase (PgdA/CDA1 family)